MHTLSERVDRMRRRRETRGALATKDQPIWDVLDRLAGADGTTRATASDVAAILGCHTNTVYRGIGRMVESGHLGRERTQGPGTSQLTTVWR